MTLPDPQRPIGLFDSGMGGLTVLSALQKQLPNESFHYLGDTARLPYGTKSHDTVIHYAIAMTKQLVAQNIKMLVVACNTATTAALPTLQSLYPDLPIIGVVEPGARAAVKATNNNHIAILATETTIASEIYQQTLLSLSPGLRLVTQPCGLFVALAEEGCVDDDIARSAVKKYLLPVINHDYECDTLILGCTHFPVLKKPIQAILGEGIHLIDSAKATADTVRDKLQTLNLLNQGNQAGETKFYVTDLPERFIRVGKLFLGKTIANESVQLIDGHQAN